MAARSGRSIPGSTRSPACAPTARSLRCRRRPTRRFSASTAMPRSGWSRRSPRAAPAGARRRGVPIVALKTGRTPAGADLTLSHTASLAGADAAMAAFLRRAGIVPVASIPVLLESLKLLHLHGPLPARDIASLSCSGGEAALIADAVAGRRLAFRALTPAQAAQVGATLPQLVTVSNPLDYHTFTWGNEAALTETFAAMMAA